MQSAETGLAVSGSPEVGKPGSMVPARPALFRATATIENSILAIALVLIMLLPLIESTLRSLVSVGIVNTSGIVQHLTLVVGMIGGAVAAREGRMLSISTAETFLRGRARSIARTVTYAFAAIVAVYLCVAALQFLQIEREVGKILAYGIPIWIVETVLPIGFGLVALRLMWSSAPSWSGRAVCIVLTALGVWIGSAEWVSPESLRIPALIALGLATLFGAPVFVTLGGAALILFWSADSPIASIPLDHYRLVTNPTLPSIPLFTMAGYFLAEGGASKRLIRVFQACFGSFRGGPALVTAFVCAFFTSFTGASGVTILALGGLLMPILISARFSDRAALGLITGSGSLGLLLPPCLPLILYAIISKVTIEEMFLGGILPGLLLLGLTAWWGISQSPKIDKSAHKFDAREAGRAAWEAKWELLLPIVALTSLFSGFATPVEAAAITALYALAIETFLYRDLTLFGSVPKVLTESGLVIGGVLMILGVALGFTNYLIDADFPTRALEWVTASVDSPWLFLIYLNIFLIIVGCVMDIFSAIIVVVPLIVPMGEAFHIDPVHLGIVFLANLELGYLTPPVGMNLFLASYRLNKPMPEVYRAALPMILVLLIGVILITYVPAMTTFLPQLILK